MNRNILFIDEDNRICRNYYEFLQMNSYTLLDAKSYEEAVEHIDQHECRMMVFGAPENEQRWQMCLRLMKERPYFPIVFILRNDSEQEKEIKLTSFYRVLRPFAQKARFLYEVGALYDLGTIVEGLPVSNSKGSEPGLPEDLTSDLDFNISIEKILTYIQKQYGGECLYWIRANEWAHVKADPGNYKGHQGWNPASAAHRIPELLQEDLEERLIHLGRARAKAKTRGEILIYGEGKELFLEVPVPSQSGEVIGHIVIEKPKEEDLFDHGAKLKGLLKLLSQHLGFCLEHVDAKKMSYKDDVTSLYNQRYMSLVLDQEIERAKRNNCKFSVLFVDVDFFKLVNDSNGHMVGSALLQRLAKALGENIRSTDFAFRYGGDEFVVILSGADTSQALVVGERIRELIEQTEFEVEGKRMKLTVSIGLATYPDHAQNSSDIIRIADEAMYHGKNKSRNIVYIAS